MEDIKDKDLDINDLEDLTDDQFEDNDDIDEVFGDLSEFDDLIDDDYELEEG